MSTAPSPLLDRIIAQGAGQLRGTPAQGRLAVSRQGRCTAALQVAASSAGRATGLVAVAREHHRDAAGAAGSGRGQAQVEQLKKVLPNHPQTRYFEARLAFQNQRLQDRKGDCCSSCSLPGPTTSKCCCSPARPNFRAGLCRRPRAWSPGRCIERLTLRAARRLLAQIQIQLGRSTKCTGNSAALA